MQNSPVLGGPEALLIFETHSQVHKMESPADEHVSRKPWMTEK